MRKTRPNPEISIRRNLELLGHTGYGVTELRVFKPRPLVAYVDSIYDAVRLVQEMVGYARGVYVGVQPRPLRYLNEAPSRWTSSVLDQQSNCLHDDIEFITTCFWAIDVASELRRDGHPASEEELLESLDAAYVLSQQVGLALTSTICFSGNGHYVLTPIVPIRVDNIEIAHKFRELCQQIAMEATAYVSGVKFDPVFNLSRVMRLMGTLNLSGIPIENRPHRTASFVTKPVLSQSKALHHMILNTEVDTARSNHGLFSRGIRCDLRKMEECDFVKWCRDCPEQVERPQWLALATNLARLEGGPELFHEITRLDEQRYDYQDSQRLIERVLKGGYSAMSCESISNLGFRCQELGSCQAVAPMFLTCPYSRLELEDDLHRYAVIQRMSDDTNRSETQNDGGSLPKGPIS